MVKKVVVCNKASKELVKEYQWIKRMKEDILNLPEPVAPKDIALLMGYSKSTIYRWHKNPCRYGIEGKLNFSWSRITSFWFLNPFFASGLFQGLTGEFTYYE